MLRQAFTAACREARAEVKLKHDPPKPQKPPACFAYDASDRQHRRKTWAWRREHNQLPHHAQVDTVLRGDQRLARILEISVEVRRVVQ